MAVLQTMFNQALKVFETEKAAQYASALFHESFNSAFPIPVACRILDTPIQLKDWRQYVAIYTWPDGVEECVGFCNWIRYKDVYLEGGLTVKTKFFQRLPRAEFRQCAERGGIAQILMETAAMQLNDCAAWFAYCGNPQALQVDLRVGFTRTDHPYLLVKWMQALSESLKQKYIDEILKIGPF